MLPYALMTCVSSWSAVRCCHWSCRALTLAVFSGTTHPWVWGFSPWLEVCRKLKCLSVPPQLANTAKKTLNAQKCSWMLGEHQELEQGWSNADDRPGGAGRTVKESRCCDWSGLCRIHLLGMEGRRKQEWVVSEQLHSICNSKTTQKAVAVHDVQR